MGDGMRVVVICFTELPRYKGQLLKLEKAMHFFFRRPRCSRLIFYTYHIISFGSVPFGFLGLLLPVQRERCGGTAE